MSTPAMYMRAWLILGIALIGLMVTVGGITRLTGSGLSIVEWKPVTGIIPPLSQQDWQKQFEQYQQFPEYKKVNHGMRLQQFKKIFLWEYVHRLLGRLIGIVFIVPFVLFYWKGWIPKKTVPSLLLIFLLGGLQGLMGWYMVRSGLNTVPHVSHFRLAAHQGIALLLISLLYWQLLSLNESKIITKRKSSVLKIAAVISLTLIVMQITLGALVAGLKAGFSYNNFPWMGEGLLPPSALASKPLLYNGVMLQFIHRWLAFLVLSSIVSLFYLSKTRYETYLTKWLLALVVFQVALGIATLMLQVPIILGVLHQFMAIIILLVIVRLLHE